MNILQGTLKNGNRSYHVPSTTASERNHVVSYHMVVWDEAQHGWQCDCLAGRKGHTACKHIKAVSAMKQQERAAFRQEMYDFESLSYC